MPHGSSWWIVGAAHLICAISILVEVAPADGWTSALAVLTGATAYITISVNPLLAVRRPFLERHFGPLDRSYTAHRVIGTPILGVEWYARGPAALAALVDRVVEDRRVGHGARLHQEAYEWRRTVTAAAKPSTVG